MRKIITFKKLFVINCLSKRDLQAEHTEHSINKNLVILKLRNLVDTSYDLKKMLMIKNHLTRSKFLQSAILRHLPFQWGIILSDVNKISNALHSTNLVQQDSSCYYSLLCTKKFNISLYFEICVLKPKVGLSYKNINFVYRNWIHLNDWPEWWWVWPWWPSWKEGWYREMSSDSPRIKTI